jgi:hypothetical protein
LPPMHSFAQESVAVLLDTGEPYLNTPLFQAECFRNNHVVGLFRQGVVDRMSSHQVSPHLVTALQEVIHGPIH